MAANPSRANAPYQTTNQQQQMQSINNGETSAAVKRAAARETLDILEEVGVLLNINLTRQQLTYCVSMIENGVNPEALANVIRDLRAQSRTQGGAQG